MSEQNSPVEGIQPNEASHGDEAAVTTPPQAAPMYPVAYVDPSSGMMVVPSAQGAPVAPAQMGVVQMPANYYVPVNYAPVNYGTPHHVVPAAVPGQAGGVQQAPVSYGTPMMATPHHVAPAAAPGQVPGHNGGVQQVPVSYVTPTAATPQNVVQYASPSGQISEGTPAPNQTATAAVTPSDVRASGDCGCGTATGPLVYAIGTLGYDLMTEARRDSFKQAMPLVDSANIHNTEQHPSADWTPDYTVVMVPGNPFDVRQLTNYLLGPPDLITGNGILTLGEEADDYAVVRIEGADNMYEAHSLIWTLNLELTPIYAIEPVGPYASQVYKQLALFLEGQSLPNTENDQGEIIYETGIIDKISIPGILTGKTVQLFSGQVVPVIQISSPRGLYGWRTSVLIDTVITTVTEGLELESADLETLQYKLRFSLESFLERIYYDLRNLGQTSHDRAFNYAAVNAFQLADILAKVLQIEDEANTTTTTMQLDTIQVVRSPFCRIDSDCWDVKLKFFNPENDQQAKKVLRYTIDVSDVMPVTLGQPRIWNEV